ncbi:hypothetical protein D3C81_1763180 [compost metagenome]
MKNLTYSVTVTRTKDYATAVFNWSLSDDLKFSTSDNNVDDYYIHVFIQRKNVKSETNAFDSVESKKK